MRTAVDPKPHRMIFTDGFIRHLGPQRKGCRNASRQLILLSGFVASNKAKRFQPAPQCLSSICKPIFPDGEFWERIGTRNSRKQDGSFPFVKNDLNLKKVEEFISSLKTIFAMMKPTHLMSNAIIIFRLSSLLASVLLLGSLS
uniref:Uncharacterized protein n=1 Tax=Arundo donax TaxID=35708 RepID=A0A0A9CSQ2_ARUDO